ncbi:FG-GAP repeat protein [Planomonospora sp. ID91781]|uniref:FG-GAP repeat protein n=1 Tax=Planomonospora sp. ID91781 TaxID=2738135 RepID=UPI0018C3A64A|nr:FG-GAP repeat protein [Planomonospora sp. ID91781]MBG0819279.1 FG-GAP repeat protein [Planomonospora sp. ID91781]
MRFLAALVAAVTLPVLPALPALPVLPAAGHLSASACADAGTGDPGGDFDGDGVDDAVVGDPLADVGPPEGSGGPGRADGAGAVHVLSGVAGQGGEGAVVTAPSPAAGDGFGWSVRLVHLDGDRCADLLVGAPYTDVAGVRDAGAVYAVYGGGGREPVRLVAPVPEADAHFGWSLAGRGPLVAVGAPHEDAEGVADSGAVYLFETSALGTARRLSQNTEGVTGNGEAGDMFGWAVELGRLGGDAGEPDLAVGLPYENDDGQGVQAGEGNLDSGAVTVLFDVRARTGAQSSRKWDLREVLDADAGDRFGYALAYAEQGDTSYLAVGAPLGDGGSVRDSGLVQLFQASSTAEITPGPVLSRGAEGSPGGGYGSALAFASGGDVRLAVGVPFDGPEQRGGVHLVPPADPARSRMVSGTAPGGRLGWSLASAGNKLVAGAPDHGPSGAVALLGRNDGAVTLLSPGAGRIPAVTGGASVDFGAAAG